MRKLTRIRIEKFLEEHASDRKTLDIGCGDSYYRKYFPNCVTVDNDPAKKPDVMADAHKLPFFDGEFENILCTEVLEHLKNPPLAISEFKRVLKPGGELILTTRFIFPIHDAPGDYFRFTKYGLMELFKDWKIELLTEEAGTLETAAILLQRIILQGRFKGDKLIKLIIYSLMRILLFLNSFGKREFGDIKKSSFEKTIASSGYYLVARKP
ncbi:class I SAM-dependent methyltransferase [bacterium]|nr:MAG: class I SAM-dependent methyltransferase [bacterium]